MVNQKIFAIIGLAIIGILALILILSIILIIDKYALKGLIFRKIFGGK